VAQARDTSCPETAVKETANLQVARLADRPVLLFPGDAQSFVPRLHFGTQY
jgi:hypothetical protein